MLVGSTPMPGMGMSGLAARLTAMQLAQAQPNALVKLFGIAKTCRTGTALRAGSEKGICVSQQAAWVRFTGLEANNRRWRYLCLVRLIAGR